MARISPAQRLTFKKILIQTGSVRTAAGAASFSNSAGYRIVENKGLTQHIPARRHRTLSLFLEITGLRDIGSVAAHLGITGPSLRFLCTKTDWAGHFSRDYTQGIIASLLANHSDKLMAIQELAGIICLSDVSASQIKRRTPASKEMDVDKAKATGAILKDWRQCVGLTDNDNAKKLIAAKHRAVGQTLERIEDGTVKSETLRRTAINVLSAIYTPFDPGLALMKMAQLRKTLGSN